MRIDGEQVLPAEIPRLDRVEQRGECEALLRRYQSDNGIEKLGPIVHPTRVALTGKAVGPGLFELMAVLGPARMVARLRRAQGVLA